MVWNENGAAKTWTCDSDRIKGLQAQIRHGQQGTLLVELFSGNMMQEAAGGAWTLDQAKALAEGWIREHHESSGSGGMAKYTCRTPLP